ncbi:hypothetical protein ACJX0J_040574, partial [Zea mays]
NLRNTLLEVNSNAFGTIFGVWCLKESSFPAPQPFHVRKIENFKNLEHNSSETVEAINSWCDIENID